MESNTITFETNIAYPAKRRSGKSEDEQPRIIFTIPTHSELLPFLSEKPPKTVTCYYRNLKFKYGSLSRGTAIKVTAEIEYGKRGGVTLHIKQLELISEPVQDLTKVDSKMMNKWTKQFEKQNGTNASTPALSAILKQGTLPFY